MKVSFFILNYEDLTLSSALNDNLYLEDSILESDRLVLMYHMVKNGNKQICVCPNTAKYAL